MHKILPANNAKKKPCSAPNHRKLMGNNGHKYQCKLSSLVVHAMPSQSHMEYLGVQTIFRKEKQAQRESFGTKVNDIRAGRPASKPSGGPSIPWKNKHLGADIHDMNTGTSMTRGGCNKLRAEEPWADFRLLDIRVGPGIPRFCICERTNACLDYVVSCEFSWFLVEPPLRVIK